MRRRSCAAGQRPGTGRGRRRRRRARPGRRARRARRPRTRTPPGGSGWRGAPGRAGPGSPRAGTAAPRRQPCRRAGSRGCGRRAWPGGGGCGSAARGRLCAVRRCRPGPVPASPRRRRPTGRRSGIPARRLPGRPAAGPAPMPRRRASIAASISAAAAGGALRYRASSSGAPARNWITCPVRRRPGRQRHPRVCCLGELAHLRRGERGGHGDVVPGQQLPRLGVPVLTAGRAGGQGVPELGPHGGQHQHRGPAGVAQQLPQPGGDPLAQPALGRCRGRTGPRSATPRSAARCPAAPAAPHRGGTGRSGATAATAGPGPAAAPGPPSRPGSCPWRTRRPAPRSRCGRPPPRAPPGPAPGRARAARTAAAPAAPAARPRAAPAGAPPGRTGRSPPPAAAPPP